MENTGRIAHGIYTELRELLYSSKHIDLAGNEMSVGADVDSAHIIMLYECGYLPDISVTKLLNLINELRTNNFKELQGRDNSRGAYTLYEDYLIEKLGIDTAGSLQLARSRNDRNAAITKLRARNIYIKLVKELLSLQGVLLNSAEKYAAVTMPVYTHYQAAQPIVLGHYLAGIAQSVDYSLSMLLHIAEELNESPLGAGAIAGTSIKIDTLRTAELLGFTKAPLNSIYSIASRDYILRILSVLAVMCPMFSRYASDLLIWSSSESGMISFPDELVGASSMMPQKRNAFMLEHIQGASAKAAGALIAALSAQHSVPYSNSIAVNAESLSYFWQAAADMNKVIILTRYMTDGIIPDTARMVDLCRKNYTSATAAADFLTINGNIPFREAHKAVGAIIKEIEENKEDTDNGKLFTEKLTEQFSGIRDEMLDPAYIASVSEYGGGPGRNSVKNCINELKDKTKNYQSFFSGTERAWAESASKLSQTVHKFIK